MKFTAIIASAITIACANALAAFGNMEYNVQAGKPFLLNWIDQVNPTVTVKLKNGPKGALQDVLVIASNVSGKNITWTPPATLPSDTYAFEIIDGGIPNWSPQFQFVGAAPTTTSTSSSTRSTSSVPTTTSTQTTSTTSSPSSSPTSSPSSSSSQTPRPTQSGGNLVNPNSGIKSKSSPLALVAVMIATLVYLN